MEKDETTRYMKNKKKIADIVKCWDDIKWQTIQHKKKTKMPAKFGILGKSTGGKLLKAAKEKRTWHLYIGNLHKDTVSDNVCGFL